MVDPLMIRHGVDHAIFSSNPTHMVLSEKNVGNKNHAVTFVLMLLL